MANSGISLSIMWFNEATNIVNNNNIDAGRVKSPIIINNAQTDSENAAIKPKNILKDIEITPVSNVDEVLKIALTKELKPVEWIEVENLPKSKTGEKPVTGSTH